MLPSEVSKLTSSENIFPRQRSMGCARKRKKDIRDQNKVDLSQILQYFGIHRQVNDLISSTQSAKVIQLEVAKKI